MNAPAAEAQLSDRGDGHCAIAGALTLETVPWIWQQLTSGSLLARAREADLGAVADADSAGLAMLVAWRANCKALGVDLQFAQVPARLVALAQLTDAQGALG
jgi:ABC-type transporter Mla MlaB component